MEPSQNLFDWAQEQFSAFSEVEKKIARLMLEDPEGLIQCSMPELAQKTGVSQGSINNFAKKASQTGFAGFKLLLAKHLSAYRQPPFSTVEDDDRSKDVLRKTISQVERALEYTYDLNTQESLDKAADLLLQARRIELYGFFLSGVAAYNFQYLLLQLGLRAQYISDVLLCPVSASLLDEHSVVVAISNSGRTKDILDPVRMALDRGASVIAITSNAASPLARMATVTLLAAGSAASVSSRLTEIQFMQMLLCHSLCAQLQHRMDEDGTKRFFAMRDLISSHGCIE